MDTLVTACAEFARCIRDGISPRTDGVCGLRVVRVVRVLEAASASLAQRGATTSISAP
jgi:predicted dehydrogenase